MIDYKKKQKVLFLGDSITQRGLYIAYLEIHMRMNFSDSQLEFINLGLSSENLTGLAEPVHPGPIPCILDMLDKIMLTISPDVIFICYGMNDPIFSEFNQENFDKFRAYFK